MPQVIYIKKAVIDRTKTWIVSQAQPGTMLYKADAQPGDSSRQSDADLALNSYVVWALAVAGATKSEMPNTINLVKEKARNTENAFALALAINALEAVKAETEQIQ